MNKINGQFASIEQITGKYFSANTVNHSAKVPDISFEDVLKQKQTDGLSAEPTLKFSKHAAMRLTQRNINLSDDQSMRLQKGIAAANSKGVNDSLVLVDDMAFIVNVPSKTVVTAMDQAETNSNVFTNIDGAVIM